MQTLMRKMLLAAIIVALAYAAHADSLWSNQSQSLFTDARAHTVGDLLTIVIVESSSASTQAKHTTSKSMNAQANAGTGIFSGFTGLGAKASRSSDGEGTSQTSTQLTDRMTVTIKEVLPNGNLHIEGTRTIKLEKDTMTLTFSGNVRPQDIAPDNTISSVLVADQCLITKGGGPIAEKQRPRLLYNLLTLLW